MRITPLEPPYSPELEETLHKWMPPGAPVPPLALFRTLARSPLLFERMRPLGAGLLNKGTLPPRDRELCILRTCARCGAEYEWGVHAAGFARAVGLSDAEVRGTLSDYEWPQEDASLIRAMDELHDRANLSDDTFARLRARYSDEQLLELFALAGFYHLISFVANASGVPREPWAARFQDR
jgi:alkylhydroperoxidase family enzyme